MIAWVLMGAGFFALDAGAAEGAIRFNRDIRPILSDNCFLCHGPDKNKRKAKLRLDDRAIALDKKAIVPGDVSKSELVRRIFTTDPDDQMPPPDSGKHLTAAQRKTLKNWIASGAEYQPQWAYVVPVRPALPTTQDRQWAHNAIDSFILERLEAEKIKPSPEADRRTLLRRLSLDLIGLPPTYAEVEAFVADQDANAYEKQVDRLLASPHFGERMAVDWLDLARFADTVGYHGDQNQHNFPYRDYVINSFNSNKPFDQFTIEQLAGDLLPNATTEQRVATGFNRQNMVTREGGAQPGEYLAKYTADRVRTVATTFLGSTMGCCECHDHKFDPFSTKDFYSLGAFFADMKQWGVYMDYGYTPNPDLRGFSNDHPFPPEILVESPYLKQRMARLHGQMDALAAKVLKEGKHEAGFENWCNASAEFLKKSPSGWVTPVASIVAAKSTAAKGAAAAKTDAVLNSDGSILFTGKAKKGDDEQIELTLPAGWVSAIKLELLPNEKHGGSILRDGAKNTSVSLSAVVRSKAGARETRLGFYHAEADHKDLRYVNGYSVLGILGGWKTESAHPKIAQTAVYLLDKPFKAAEGDRLVISIKSDDAGCVRLSVSPFGTEFPLKADPADGLSAALRVPASERAAQQQALLTSEWFESTAANAEAFTQYKSLHRDWIECRNGMGWSMVTETREPIPQRVLPRGNWQDQSGEVVVPATPHFLPQLPNPDGRRLTRLDLAKWLVAKDNPLTARTFVNRLWKQFFGSAISAIVDDLGAQGEPPTHPDLLDWLAVEFRDGGWDIKHMVKLMVMSSAYRQSSKPRPELHDIDPNNRLLASQNPRRLEAEFVRDNALSIAGLLTLDIGGPSVHPYQPAGYYVNIQFPNRDYYPEADDRQFRRGLYTHWQRTFMHPMLANFDAPSREECTANRNISNTPQQALTLLNDPSFVEAARVFAAKLLAGEAKSDNARLDAMFKDALLRPIKADEKASLLKFLAQQRAYYKANVEDAKKLTSIGVSPVTSSADISEWAAWTTACRVVLNLHEVITRY
jgi:hypothetical protein